MPRVRHRAARRVLLGLALGLLLPPAAQARRVARPRFEPTDLELERSGVVELDLQVGYTRAPGAWLLVLPDFEVDLGLTRYLEIDLDGSLAFDPSAPSTDSVQIDNLWLSAKIGLLGFGAAAGQASGGHFGLGLQLGPRLPTAIGASGVGGELLLLLGHSLGDSHVVLNAGGFIDPEVAGHRYAALQLGVDLDLALTTRAPLSLQAEIGGVYALSSDPSQLFLSLGLTWAPTEALDLSCTAVFGVLPGDERAGVLLGVSPKIPLWRRR